eukprot:TRINITY_DN5857_c0_g1_i5.p2 TRINITY_DN5857_c0_g1~~TRINITY_DN5857_c0_g1_i5.p2  ORF type:complete len:174 (+),score=40.43 TRINITY_DN5857_c0_g1_i5:79-522(+)
MRLLLCADLWGVKVNLDVHFRRQPTIGELRSSAVEVFTAEAEATRPAAAPRDHRGQALGACGGQLAPGLARCCAPPSGGDKDGGPPEGGEPHPPATAAGTPCATGCPQCCNSVRSTTSPSRESQTAPGLSHSPAHPCRRSTLIHPHQ